MCLIARKEAAVRILEKLSDLRAYDMLWAELVFGEKWVSRFNKDS
jgi:hypothetical protein